MAISDIPIFSMLRTRLEWHQERQRLLAENVANSDTPNFRPRDLAEPDLAKSVAQIASLNLVRTDPGHLTGAADTGTAFRSTGQAFQVRPAGNAVNLEDEMLKVAANQMDYPAVSALYGRSLGLIKAAIAKK